MSFCVDVILLIPSSLLVATIIRGESTLCGSQMFTDNIGKSVEETQYSLKEADSKCVLPPSTRRLELLKTLCGTGKSR